MEDRRARIAARIQGFFDIFEHMLNYFRRRVADSQQREAIRRADYAAELRRRGVLRNDETLAEYQARSRRANDPSLREQQDADEERMGRAIRDWGQTNGRRDS